MLDTATEGHTETLQPLRLATKSPDVRSFNILRATQSRMLNQGHFCPSELTASLLARQSPYWVTANCYDTRNNLSERAIRNGVLSSCLMTVNDLSPAENKTQIHVFDPACEDVPATLSVEGYVRAIAYRKQEGLVLIASCHSSSSFKSKLFFRDLKSPNIDLGSSVRIGLKRRARVHDITFTNDDTIAVATTACTHVMAVRPESERGTIINTFRTGTADALSVSSTVDGNELAFVTDDGRAQLKDIRAPRNDSVWSAKVCKPICDNTRVNLQVGASGRDIYLACEDGLSAWDIRMNFGLPSRTFDQFEAPTSEWYYSSPLNCIFDLEETASGGLLAATGETGAVHIWDSNRGGNPLHTFYVPEPAQRVQFAAWTGASPCRPGLWIHARNSVYMLRMNGPASAS